MGRVSTARCKLDPRGHGGGIGPVAILGGKSALSTLDLLAARGQGKRWFSVDMAVTVATIVFATVLFAALARLEYLLADGLAGLVASEPRWGARVAAHVAIALALGAALWFTSGKINANRFSLHALYRNRLAREFLGAANAGRARTPSPASTRATTSGCTSSGRTTASRSCSRSST